MKILRVCDTRSHCCSLTLQMDSRRTSTNITTSSSKLPKKYQVPVQFLVVHNVSVVYHFFPFTGVRALTRGLVTLPPRCIQEPLVVRDMDGRHPRGLLVVHCFCVYTNSALLGDFFGVSRSVELDFLSFLSYLWFFFSIFAPYHLL